MNKTLPKKTTRFKKPTWKNNIIHQNPALNFFFWKMCYEVKSKIRSRLYS